MSFTHCFKYTGRIWKMSMVDPSRKLFRLVKHLVIMPPLSGSSCVDSRHLTMVLMSTLILLSVGHCLYTTQLGANCDLLLFTYVPQFPMGFTSTQFKD